MAKNIKKAVTPNLDQSLTPELLGQVIKAKRTQSNLSIEDAAGLCGVAKQTFMNIEHGQHTSQLATILKVCSALGVKILIQSWQLDDEVFNVWQ
ncbi:MAG: helix-turn-helix transcriptional regulator [Legionellaceae bacterium]|nr:helix-turn-helix transcriptional regulator [Legionellaceae bacterium]